MKKKVVILGSTGSIGTQTLDVITHQGDIEVLGLTANSQIDLLEKQIETFHPQMVCVMREDKAQVLRGRLLEKGLETEVVTGIEGLVQVATLNEAEIVVTAVVGMIGLVPTVEAIKRGKTIALANKETLVTAGDLVMGLAREKGVDILPVDSEHSAIFQSLQGNHSKSINRLILTASGGPFRTFTTNELKEVTVEQALKHPNWVMGSKITIDSATLMNKGLEVIEAKHLFNVAPSEIEVVVHKESIVHSMVAYKDGSVIAQLGMPDMRHPIAYALNYPERKEASYIEKLDLVKIGALSFEAPRIEDFPCLKLAYDALEVGGTMGAVLNAANEIVVASFLNKEISFLQIPEMIHRTMDKHICISRPSLEQILECDRWAREYCREQVAKCY
ncbi:MAG: 1-deoxy-D-xylulose-5-phosphate reductoisomerase [Cellulosilyticum sp.]|nr:1-deoxy-D-xylulose-5-phosphate reductoisomerase [Cellulosilyticum sp.]